MQEGIEQIAEQDGRYSPEALKFVFEGLGHTVKDLAEQQEPDEPAAADQPHHVTGRQLCEGLRQLAVQRWGRLAMLVLERWGVKKTGDFGEIVYLMISHQWMSCQTSDSIEDFENVYDFKTVFEERFEFESESQ